jgi:hypothetical protein
VVIAKLWLSGEDEAGAAPETSIDCPLQILSLTGDHNSVRDRVLPPHGSAGNAGLMMSARSGNRSPSNAGVGVQLLAAIAGNLQQPGSGKGSGFS